MRPFKTGCKLYFEHPVLNGLLYEPKQSSKMQLLEANGNLTRMIELVTIGEEERKLVEQGIALNQSLLSRLVDSPTPAGPTPRELHSGKRKPLPVLTETVGLVQQQRVPTRTELEEGTQKSGGSSENALFS